MESSTVARATPVFAAEQVEGYAIPSYVPKTITEVAESFITAERFIAAAGALILHAGDRAFYREGRSLPVRERGSKHPDTGFVQSPRTSHAIRELG